jgi:hypothetical protein
VDDGDEATAEAVAVTRTRAGFAAAALLTVAAAYLPIQAARADTTGTVFVQTVPATANVRLAVGGMGAITDSTGRAIVNVANLNGVADTVRVTSGALSHDVRVGLGRVAILPHVVAHQSRLVVGLNVWSRTRLELRSGHTGVAVRAVDSVRLRSMTGIVKTVHPRRAPVVELLARRPQLVHDRLIAQTVTWSVAGIDAGPGVALTSAQGRFDPYGKRTWPLELSAVQGTVRISTVPATAGVQFIVDGASTVTGPDGTAKVQVSDLNDVDARLSLGYADAAGQEVSLLKVTRAPPRAVHERELVVALAVRRPVTLRFTDLNGAPIPASRVTSVRVQADQTTSRFDAAQLRAPITLLSAKATLVHNGWSVHRLVYAMTSATVDGGQAVFAGQQRFTPAAGTSWNVKLSVFSIHITAHDALLGTRVSSHLVITRPDDSTYTTAVPSGGSGAVMTSVVRGDYDLHFSAAVLGATTPLRISRSDSFDIRIVTPLDLGLVGAVVVLLAGSAVLAGVRVARRREAGTP